MARVFDLRTKSSVAYLTRNIVSISTTHYTKREMLKVRTIGESKEAV